MKIEEDENGTFIMNAKDLNLSSYIDEILESGVIDSLKIEGRTKSPYYVGITTKVYREAIDDFYEGKFDPEKYYKELLTTKHRGFSDGYLIHRPYEKLNTQKLDSSISEGEKQVYALVDESGEYFFAKDKVEPDTIYEIVSPEKEIKICKNEIGEIFKENGNYFIKLNKIETKNGKILTAVHSGNTNPVKLPCRLPPFTFFRK